MADPRQTLHELIRRFGTSLAEDSLRCKGMLRDLCGSSKREIAGLVAAIEEKVTTELLKPHPIPVSLRANMIIRLETHRGLAPDLAMWTVDTWGLVLGVWTQAELDQFPSIAPPPSSTPPVTNHSSEPILDLPVVEVEPPQLDITQDLPLTATERQRGGKKAIVLDNGKRLEVNLPGGLTVGQKLRLQGQGKRDFITGSVGDLYLVVKERSESSQPTTQVDIDPYQQSQVPQTEWNIDQVPLESEKGVYYQKLQNLLKTQNWEKADSETYRLMINIVGRTEGDWIRENELLNFPYKDLRTIDRLWLNASQGFYGFSIQKEIYVRCGAKLNGKYPGDAIWYEFCTAVAWRVNKQWKNYKDLTWNSIHVQGHLPNCRSLLGDWSSIFIPSVALRLVNQNSSLLSQRTASPPLPQVPKARAASQQAQPTQLQWNINQISLESEKGVDYQQLRDLLKAQNWKEADQETYRLMVMAARGNNEENYIRDEELRNFPCKDLKTIDRLWINASQGRYGFSIQKEIYLRCGAKLDGTYPGDEVWEKFGTEVGWRVNNQWLDYEKLTWNSIHVRGHLPGGANKTGFGRGGWLVFVDGWRKLFSRIETCTAIEINPNTPTNKGFDLPNNGGRLDLIEVPGGTLVMEGGHRVNLKSFWIGKYPVTQRQYQAVMGKNPSHFKGNLERPVENVSWHDAIAFCEELSQQLGETIDLPSETQWEWAARGATKSKGYTYAGSNNLDEVGWYYENSGSKTHPVGQKKPNELGIYDMSGNVWEWCKDNWTGKANVLPQNGAALTQGGTSDRRAARGGSWLYDPGFCRCALRSGYDPGLRVYDRGFRGCVAASAL